MNANVKTPTSTAMTTVVDGFDIAASDPSASPIRGVNVKFKDGEYYSFADKLDVRERTFVVLDRREGWQFLQKDCPPEYVMRLPGEPRPPQPHVEKAEWPLNLNGVPEHPWRLCRYLYLLDAATGEISTFWSNTIGGRIAVDELNDQVVFMRRMRPGAHPVVQLRSVPMPTSFGGTKPRPQFKLAGWKQTDGAVEQAQITGPTADVVEPTLSEQMDDEIPFNDSPDIDVPRTAEQKPRVTKKGVQKLSGEHR